MTALNPEGLIIVASLPEPMNLWLDIHLQGQELYIQFDHDGGLLIDMDVLEFMLQSAGVATFNPLPN